MDSSMNEQDTDEDIVDGFSEIIKDQFMENPLSISDYDYDSHIVSLLIEHFEEVIDEDMIYDIYTNKKKEIYKNIGFPLRSYEYTYITEGTNNTQEKCDYLLNIPQPDQRTKEWYEFRHNHITASNAWKCLGTPSSVNQIILEKLTPLNIEKYKPSLNDNPMTWGQRFEDISIMFYENKYNVKVDDLGCIEHQKYTFLAASPDGIITSKNNNSRLLEIKNVVSRKITKIPKPDYWMQMQLQMEVCDIDECDFLETKFIEYEGFSEFKCDINETNKGIIMMFIKNNEIPVYEYSELYKNIEDIEKWMDEKMDYYEKIENITWFKNIYWKMEEFSCIMVKRNKIWFENAISKIKDVWEIIVSERENDCKNIDNYKPKKRIKVEKKDQIDQQNIVTDVVTNNIIDPNIEVL